MLSALYIKKKSMQDYIHICSNMNVCIAFNEYAKVLMRIKIFKADYETLYLLL